jgi:hypothetical protein
VLSTEGRVFQHTSMSKVPPRGKPKLCGVSISVSGVEVGKAMSSIGPTAHKGAKGNWFRGNAWKDIKGMSGNDVGEVRDHSNAVPSIGGFVGRGVSGRSGMRKSGGRVRT